MNNLENQSDQALLELLKEENRQAFNVLYNRYWKKLYNTANKRIKDPEAAEEIVQDLFTSLWLNRHKINIHTSFESYLHSAVRYLIIACFQKQMNKLRFEEGFSKVNTIADTTTEDSIVTNDLLGLLNRKVYTLPEKCRSVFELSRKDHKTNKEIAATLGISEKTVENHMTRALKILRLSFTSLCITGTILVNHFLAS
ncbi:ECF RNA polymerase sigma factor SigW [compost metagenome]